MATTSILYYDQVTNPVVQATGNNVIILANALRVIDEGQITIDDGFADYGVKFNADAKLSVGGDYHGEKTDINQYNIYVNNTVNSARQISEDDYATEVGDAHFEKSGTLVLASQSGDVNARYDVYYPLNDKNDASMKFSASRSLTTGKNSWDMTDAPELPKVLNVSNFAAEDSLTVNGSLVGSITAENNIVLAGTHVKVLQEAVKVPVYSDTTCGYTLHSNVIRTPQLILTGNVDTTWLSATLNVAMTAVVQPNLTGNSLQANIMDVTDFQMEQGRKEDTIYRGQWFSGGTALVEKFSTKVKIPFTITITTEDGGAYQGIKQDEDLQDLVSQGRCSFTTKIVSEQSKTTYYIYVTYNPDILTQPAYSEIKEIADRHDPAVGTTSPKVSTVLNLPTGRQSSSFSNNDILANVVKATNSVQIGGMGELTADEASVLTAAVENVNLSAHADGGFDLSTTAAVDKNIIYAKIIDGGTSTEITSIDNQTLSASLDSITLEAESYAGNIQIIKDGETTWSSYPTVTTSISNNTLTAAAVDGQTVVIGSVEKNAKLTTSASNITLQESGKRFGLELSYNLSDKEYFETMSSNVVNSYAIHGTNVTIGDFCGTLSASASDITMDQQAAFYEDANNRVTIAGISADKDLHITGLMEGTISVSSDDLTIEAGGVYQAGIRAQSGTLTADGRIATDITVSIASHIIGFGICAKQIIADAYSGTMDVSLGEGLEIGIQSYNSFSTGVTGDNFDINGSITADNYGITSWERLNLRVSGSINVEKGQAILAEKIYIRQEYTYKKYTNIVDNNDTPQDDVVELSSTAYVEGDIQLGRGENTLILHSNAKLKGSMLADLGVMNVKFILDGVPQDGAIVEGTKSGDGDVTLSSGNTITIDLNYAKNGAKYTLIQYGINAYNYWKGDNAEHPVCVLYNGETVFAKVDNTGDLEIEIGGAKAHLYYDEYTNSVIVDKISGVNEDLEQFTGCSISRYDEATRSMAVTWDRSEGPIKNAAIYELEYTVYRDNGNTKCGESVLVRMTDADINSYIIRNIDADQMVVCRMRAIGDAEGSMVTAWSDAFAGTGTLTPDASAPSLSDKQTNVSDAVNGSKNLTGPAALFTWDAADSDIAMKNYVLEILESDERVELTQEEKDAGKTFEEKVVETIEAASLKGQTYLKTVTNTEAVVSGMQHLAFIYWRVKGTDIEGNASTWTDPESGKDFAWMPGISGDATAPVFVTVPGRDQAILTMVEDRSVAGKVTYDLLFQWNKAEDSGLGMKRYEIEYTLTSDTDWKNVTRIQVLAQNAEQLDPEYQYSYVVNGLAGGEYKYRISAIDYANNRSAYIGNETFGSSDVTPPSGAFTNFSTPTVTAEYVYPDLTDDDDDDDDDDEEITRYVENATVSFSWSDSYTDESGVYYKIQFSDSESFTSSKTYTYTTTVAGQKSFTIDNSTPTMPVGIFAGMLNTYWRVMAVDGKGNETGIYSQVQSFKFMDSDGAYIRHSQAPDRPFSLSVSMPKTDGVGSGEIKVSWSSNHTDLGILYYTIECSSKDGGESCKWTVDSVELEGGTGTVSKINGTLVSPTTGAALKDGTYSWSVTAYNAIGTAAKAFGTQFIQDTTRPTTVDGLAANVMTTDVQLTWNASYDKFKIDSYTVQYRLQGTTAWTTSTVGGTSTSLDVFGMKEGDYEFQVLAYDKNGNVSLDSDVSAFTVSRDGDLCDYYYPSAWLSYEEAAGTKGIEQSIGIHDAADYFYIRQSKSFSLTLNVADYKHVSGTKSGITIEVYKYEGTGTEKAVATARMTKAGTAVNGLVLDAGTYFVKVTATNTDTKEMYTLKADTVFFGDMANMEADDTAAEAKVIASRSSNPTFVSMDKTVNNEWVGYQDVIDYRQIKLAYSGKYNLKLTGLTASTDLTLTVWQDAGNGKLKSVKSLSVKGKTAASLTGILLDDAYTYYVSVNAVKGKSGQSSSYSLAMDGTEYSKGNNEDDNWKTLPAEYTLAYGGSTVDEWAGFGDAIDYRKLTLNHSGSYTFNLSGVDKTANLTLTVWKDTGKGRLQAVKIISTANKGTAAITSLLLDDANTYYVSVESKQATRGVSSDYLLSMSGTEYNKGNNEDDNWKTLPAEYSLSYGESTVNEWAGYGDAIDYRKLALNHSGSYTFELAGVDKTANLTLTVWKDTGKGRLQALKIVSTANKGAAAVASLLLDDANTYYVSVESKQATRGVSSDYLLTMSGTEFNKGNNEDDNWKTLPAEYSLAYGESTVDEWAGFGDAIDYRKLTLNYSGSYTFTMKGVDKTANLTLTVWKDTGKGRLQAVKTVFTGRNGTAAITSLLLDKASTYYVSVESKQAKQGVSSDYLLTMGGTEFTEGNNLDDNWKTLSGEYRMDAETPVTDEWIGYGDLIDYRSVDFDASGYYDFKLTELTAPVRLTVWENQNGKLRAVKMLSASKAATLQDVKLEYGKEYFVSVEATNGKQGKNSSYNLFMAADNYQVADRSDDAWNSTPKSLNAADGIELTDWVSTKDAADWFDLALPELESVDFQLGDSASAALYRVGADGALQDAMSDLSGGCYKLCVSDNGSKSGTTYEISYDEDSRKLQVLAVR